MNYLDYLDDLLLEVSDLISYPGEGSYWDFKREWYFMNSKANPERAKKGKQDLLLDIINMANNTHFRDAYIIIGVDDKTHEIYGVPEDDVNRRTTEQLTDFLSERKFANGIYPDVRVEPLRYSEKLVDVIAIKTSRNAPFYLSESHGNGARAGVVYSRQNGRNTPCDKSANSYAVERLWRHRFLLDATPYEHFLESLKDRTLWASSPEQGAPEKDFLKTAPEYTIDYSSSDDDRFESNPEYYCCNQYDTRVSYFPIIGRYHQTVLFERSGICLDGGRYQTSSPDWCFLHGPEHPHKADGYKCYIKGSENWLIHRYLFNEQSEEARIAHRRFMENVVVYENESERASFHRFVESNWSRYEELRRDAKPFVPQEFTGLERKAFVENLRTVHAVSSLLREWREHYRQSERTD